MVLKSQNKNFINIKDLFNKKCKIEVSNKVFFGKKVFKYFIGYKDAKKIRLCVYFYQK